MTETLRSDVAVVGSGFAGTILARALNARGLRVVLLEKGRHPRFALGESSTPLANLSLERLAEGYGLPDLHHLATHGRWRRHLPHLTHGLKRGFTFFHRDPPHRLLVSASPTEAVADTHWLRSDVDAHLVARAVEEGVVYRDGVDVRVGELGEKGCRLTGVGADGEEVAVETGLVVDASGPGGILSRTENRAAIHRLPSDPRVARAGAESLIYGHFEDVGELREEPGVNRLPADPAGGRGLPYEPERAAVHHLLDEGWMYVLRLDQRPPGEPEIVSAGVLLWDPPAAGEAPATTWRRVLSGYPALVRQFGHARPLRLSRLDHPACRAGAVAGDGWLRLPHAYCFADPLFSTGMAWSLAGVERAASLISAGLPFATADRDRYADLLEREADGIEDLIAAAYTAIPCFPIFVALSQLYFVAVSWAETLRRLQPEPEDAWRGFLGVGDEMLEPLFAEARRRIDGLAAADWPDRGVRDFERWLADRTATRNVAGFFDASRGGLYPADPEITARNAGMLGMKASDVRKAFERLLSE